ncbi:MAG: radical SAM family heme chaperone HemW [Anaerolineae bacterium]|nr:radical SAM family heme chaperone HemW [Anaerolineae bacterium]MDW8098866.1 radical SAM family heme chaperone HemW [Anaerolineae bacterium]
MTELPLGLYIHIPFCQRKCPYCDFNTYAGLDRLFNPYVEALTQEIRRTGEALEHPVASTLFLGGGTPTVLPVELLADVLTACRQAFQLSPDVEITSEANPGTVDQACFSGLRALGVNRLSMGVQSFDPEELRFLGRIHGANEAEAAFHAARAAGFENINLDLIYGLPGQKPETWLATLDRAIALEPEHISLYSLTIEEGTPFARWAAEGRIAYPDDDLAAELYELASERLQAAGYVQYEISNWARHASMPPFADQNPRFACQHNLIYWRYQPYLGFGAGAHSMQPGRRWWNLRSPQAYIQRIREGKSAEGGHEVISERLGMGEMMMLGLRLVREGVSDVAFQRRWGVSLAEIFGPVLDELEALGLLERLPGRVRLSPRAYLIGNQVFARFLP